jgi:murein L,D-transpeptidase YafK
LSIFLLLLGFTYLLPDPLPDSKTAADARTAVWPKLQKYLLEKRFKHAHPLFIRIFKAESIFEIWIKDDHAFRLFKQYPVCFYSGGLGTKTNDGDGKSPEGFYTIKPDRLCPSSNYHLAINIGYPNKFEKSKGYTGNAIMIHGHCASVGCYAMTDPEIDEIYTMVYKAFESGQKSIDLHIFPFRMDAAHMQLFKKSSCISFWQNIKKGYDIFEETHKPPLVSHNRATYLFSPSK